jgi:hypothetical protein
MVQGVIWFLRFRGGAWKRMRVIEPLAEGTTTAATD